MFKWLKDRKAEKLEQQAAEKTGREEANRLFSLFQDDLTEFINDVYYHIPPHWKEVYGPGDPDVQYQISIPPHGEFSFEVDWAYSLLSDSDMLSTDSTFVDMLQKRMAESGISSPEVYKRAQIDRRLFSHIISDKYYKPSKDTCIKIILALDLGIETAIDWLSRAGYTLSKSDKRDLILIFCIGYSITNIFGVNELLFRFHERTLT